ncbi:MAG TPA: hypothetical protein VIU61_10575 [Kofleriaceae bacterium]
MRLLVLLLTLAATPVAAAPATIRCDNLSTADLAIDGLLDDWSEDVLARVGSPADGAIELRCSWDGRALAIALDLKDDRVVRVRGPGHEDRVELSVSAGGAPVRVTVSPGNAIGKSKLGKPAKVAAAESLQRTGFSLETRIGARSVPGLSASTPALRFKVTFHDADLAAGGDTTQLVLEGTIELSDRKDLLDDFLRTVKLRRGDVRVDTMAELDPGRRGKERVVAGGTVIGVLTNRFAFVSLPAEKPADVRKVELLGLGPRGQQIVSAVVRQNGNGGNRDVLMLWTVGGGELRSLGQIEIRKELGASVLESTWKLAQKKRPKPKTELVIEAQPARGFTRASWNEIPAADVDPIVLPWDGERSGIAYSLDKGELVRRDLPPKKKRR